MKLHMLILMSLFAYSISSGGSAFAQVQTVYLSSEENNFYQMVNQFRKRLSLPALEIHVYLENAAKAHSTWMAQQDFLTHYGPTNDMTPFQRMAAQGYTNYTFAGENIACGHGDAMSTFRQWAASPLHLQNMLNPHYHQLGISRAGTGREACPYYWTSDFGSFADGTTDPSQVTDIAMIEQAVAAVSGSALPRPVVLAPPNPPSDDGENTTPTTPVHGTAKILQCLVPYRLGKGTLNNSTNVDTLVEADRDETNSLSLSLSYFQNAQNMNLLPVAGKGVSIVNNPDFPLVTLFAAPTRQYGGFTIQMNTQTNQAQYSSYDLSPAQSGTILCTIKYY